VTIIPAWGSHRWFDDSSEEKRRELADEAMRLMREFLQDDSIDLLILDEINIMTQYHLIESEELLPLLRARPASMTAILTGRNAAPEIIAAADLVSEIHDVKHPISAGLPPQKGIEF
jgi:cob(I)alamin adenosyltransferase